MHFGVLLLPELPWHQAAHRWQRAEAMGFDHAWTYDHLTWRSFRDEPWFSAVPTLTAAALATTRMRLGTLVASPNFRHPLPFVKELVTLDDISGGRIMAGIGAGGQGFDATALGQQAWSVRERADRFEEFVTLTDMLLRRPEMTWQGRYYSVLEARTYPGPVQQPRLPLAIAAGGRRSLQLAARLGDYWVTLGPPSDEPLSPAVGAAAVGEQVRHLEEACALCGRGPASIRRLVLTGFGLAPASGSGDELSEAAGLYEAAGVTDLVTHWPRPSGPFAGDQRTFELAYGAVLSPL